MNMLANIASRGEANSLPAKLVRQRAEKSLGDEISAEPGHGARHHEADDLAPGQTEAFQSTLGVHQVLLAVADSARGRRRRGGPCEL